MAWEDVWAVLKWVLAALAAGFIGQFGRMLAMRIIERRKATARRDRNVDVPAQTALSDKADACAAAEAAAIKQRTKLEKKRAKAAVKAAKKNTNDESS